MPDGSREPLAESTDWERIRAMTDEEVTAAAFADPDAQPLTEARLASMKRVPRAKTLRRALGLTQEEFATRYHIIPVGTLRDWEQGRSEPDQNRRAPISKSSPPIPKACRALSPLARDKPRRRYGGRKQASVSENRFSVDAQGDRVLRLTEAAACECAGHAAASLTLYASALASTSRPAPRRRHAASAPRACRRNHEPGGGLPD